MKGSIETINPNPIIGSVVLKHKPAIEPGLRGTIKKLEFKLKSCF